MMIQDVVTLRAELNELAHQAAEAANDLGTKQELEFALHALSRNIRKLARGIGLQDEDLTTINIYSKL